MGNEQKEPIREAADKLRERKGLTHGSAKLETEDGEGDFVDFFRGKDLVRYMETNPGAFSNVLKDREGRTAEETAAELVRAFFSRGLLYRTERKYKRPKPGRTRLVKWPRTLVPVKDTQFDPSSFYAWRYNLPHSVWYWVATFAIPLIVILACLFPLAPWWARLGLVYFLMTILIVLLSLLVTRYTAFAAIWAVTGSHFWIFPNMMSDQLGILDAFKPLVSFEKSKSFSDQWQARIATAVFLAGVTYILASHSPDLNHLKDDMAKAHDSFVEYMDAMSKPKSFLSGNTTQNATAQNATGSPL